MKQLIGLGIIINCILLSGAYLQVFSNNSTPVVHAATISEQDLVFEVTPFSTTTMLHPSSFSISIKSSTTPNSLREVLAQIARCESDNDPKAENPTSTAKGLLQILDGTWQDFDCQGNVFNRSDNMACGVKIARSLGFKPWNASKACWIDRINV